MAIVHLPAELLARVVAQLASPEDLGNCDCVHLFHRPPSAVRMALQLRWPTAKPEASTSQLLLRESQSRAHTRNLAATATFHCALVTKNGQLSVCGQDDPDEDNLGPGLLGRLLGLVDGGDPREATIPRAVALPTVSVHSVAAARSYMLALSSDGRVFSCGGGESGQLGLGPDMLRSDTPQQLVMLPDDVSQIACTEMTSYARTVSGHVYSWGHAGFGTLGHTDGLDIDPADGMLMDPEPTDQWTPKRIEALAEVVHFTAGYRCDAFTQTEWLFWGLAENGHLPGKASHAGMAFPRPTTLSAALAEPLGDRTVCASSSRLLLATDGSVLRVDWPKLYYEDHETPPAPAFVPQLRPLASPLGKPVIAVADKSDYTSLVVSQSGHVYMLHFYSEQAFEVDVIQPLNTLPLGGAARRVEQIACSDHLCVMRSDSHSDLWTILCQHACSPLAIWGPSAASMRFALPRFPPPRLAFGFTLTIRLLTIAPPPRVRQHP